MTAKVESIGGPAAIRIGLIGLDTSHVSAFTRLLNDPAAEFHVPGGKVTAAFPGTPSLDFAMSYARIEGYTAELRDQWGIAILESAEAVAEACDALMLESVDGRVHPDLFRRLAEFGKPIFVDKPLALTSADARTMLSAARSRGIPFMSCSPLRYAEGLAQALGDRSKGELIGADCFGPMAIEPTQPGLFWYGIHSVEMLFACLGKGCVRVTAASTEDHDTVTGVWEDGRIGTVRGNRRGNPAFGALLHRESGTQFVDVYASRKPYYASMLERVLAMFRSGEAPIDPEETLQIIRFIEAANESRMTGKSVTL